MREIWEIVCENCNRSFKREARFVRWNKKQKLKNFCGEECRRINKSNNIITYCANCKKQIKKPKSIFKKSKSGNLFCSHACSAKSSNHLRSYDKHPNFINGIGSYRKRAIKKYGLNCAKGGECHLYGIKLPDFLYEVDHKDEDRKNNKIENLQILCFWCHKEKTILGVF